MIAFSLIKILLLQQLQDLLLSVVYVLNIKWDWQPNIAYKMIVGQGTISLDPCRPLYYILSEINNNELIAFACRYVLFTRSSTYSNAHI